MNTNSSNTKKVAIVTGARSGLGNATACAFTEANYCVVGLDVCASNGHGNASFLQWKCDVSDASVVDATVQAVLQRFGRIDVAVNCAGIDFTYPLDELTVDQFDRVISVNLRGPFLIAKAVWPAMTEQGGGHIINVASTAAVRAWSGASAYHASKFGLVGFGRGLGVEGRPVGIRVTTVIPGGMRTGFFDRFAEQDIPMPDPAKLQDPANVARSILFAAELPPESVLQELIVTPVDEPSWP